MKILKTVLVVLIALVCACACTPLNVSMTTEATFQVEDAVFNGSFITTSPSVTFGTPRLVRSHLLGIVDGIFFVLDKDTLELKDYIIIGTSTEDEIIGYAFYEAHPSTEERGVISTIDYRFQEFVIETDGSITLPQAIWTPSFDDSGDPWFTYPTTVGYGTIYIDVNGLLFFYVIRPSDSLTKICGYDTQNRYFPGKMFTVDPRVYRLTTGLVSTFYNEAVNWRWLVGRENKTYSIQYKKGSSFASFSSCGNYNCSYDCFWDLELPTKEYNYNPCWNDTADGRGRLGLQSVGFGINTAAQILEENLPGENVSTILSTMFTVVMSVDMENSVMNFSKLGEITLPKLDSAAHDYEVAHISAGVADDRTRYFVVGDDMGYIHAAALHELPDRIYEEQYLNSWRIIDNIPAGKTEGNFTIDEIVYDPETMDYYVLSDTWIYRVAVPDCETQYSSWTECVAEGGLREYCYFNVTDFKCKHNVNAEPVQQPPTITACNSTHVHEYGDVVELSGNFDYAIVHQCRWRRVSNGEVLEIVNGTVYGGNRLVCSTPALPDEHADVAIEVDILFEGKPASTSSVTINMYSCYVEDRSDCLDVTRPECGYCFSPESKCTVDDLCDTGQWVQSDEDYVYTKSVTPSSGPSLDIAEGIESTVQLEVFGYSRMSGSTYASQECLFYAYTDPDVLLYSTPAVFSHYDTTADTASFNCSAPTELATERLIALKIDEVRVSYDAVSFSFYDCGAWSLSCSDCISPSREGCHWCPRNGSCMAGPCLDSIAAESECPAIIAYESALATQYGGDVITATLNVVFDSPYFECLFASANSTELATVTANYSAEVYAKILSDGRVAPFEQRRGAAVSGSLMCTTPQFPAGDSYAKVKILFNSTTYTEYSSFAIIQCASFSESCLQCVTSGKGVCGYCLTADGCRSEKDCDKQGKEDNFLLECPRIVSADPIEGSESGNTSIIVTGPSFVPGQQYQCRFGGNDTVNGSLINLTSTESLGLQCYTPPHAEGFVELDVTQEGVSLTENTISFVYDDCSPGNGSYSCNECVRQRLADCGWCLSTAACSGRVACPHDAFFAESCPIAELDLSTIGNGGGHSVLTSFVANEGDLDKVDYLLNLVNMTWQCVWDLGGSKVTTNATVASAISLVCPTPSYIGREGAASFSVTADSVEVLKKDATVYITHEVEYDYIGWFHPFGVAILALLTYVMAIIIVAIVWIFILIGIVTPVASTSGRLYMFLQLSGALLLPASCIWWITTPGVGDWIICNGRTLLVAVSAALFVAPTSAKQLYLFYQFLRYKEQRKKETKELVYKLPHFFLIALVVLMVFIEVFVWLIWVIFNATSAEIVERKLIGFAGTSSKHTVCYSSLHYLFEAALAIPLLTVSIAATVVSFATLSQITPWKQSKFLFVAQMNICSVMVFVFILVPLAFELTRDWVVVLLMPLGIFFGDIVSVLILYVPRIFVILFRRKSMDDVSDYINELEFARRKKRKKEAAPVPKDKGRLAQASIAAVVGSGSGAGSDPQNDFESTDDNRIVQFASDTHFSEQDTKIQDNFADSPLAKPARRPPVPPIQIPPPEIAEGEIVNVSGKE